MMQATSVMSRYRTGMVPTRESATSVESTRSETRRQIAEGPAGMVQGGGSEKLCFFSRAGQGGSWRYQGQRAANQGHLNHY